MYTSKEVYECVYANLISEFKAVAFQLKKYMSMQSKGQKQDSIR